MSPLFLDLPRVNSTSRRVVLGKRGRHFRSLFCLRKQDIGSV